ncbi:prepilin-type N-terminal cleavage/methylation domain-containing protein [Dissulfurispira thermophila]|uniref:Prepilin-type N-terminal cleavage/methylation domain-containing protein n=1 Tax=Dissulfurispira thermophila TaxID=2715679 RepID=A0A7G1H2U4_9BACT|nr:prepilin-type N-terminal cleavage/methylation domain-containing protein [Dissulfurispira thermophila]BCB97114.1 prepilin-type N-terminal cleavage/methylation domain-containing protein [Dissulfurispira thermophila]
MTEERSQKMGKEGFTLIEIAIVLVIIGIILGAVLKGQELINNAKIKRAYSQYREIVAAVYTYYDKYGKYPGDDNTASSRWSGVTNGNNNGVIDGFTINCGPSVATETCQAWLHMRSANILTGATDTTNGTRSPSNAYGGGIGIGYNAIQGLTTMWIGFDNVPGDVCQSIDQQYDDGAYNTGSIRGSGNYNTNPNIIYDLYFRL